MGRQTFTRSAYVGVKEKATAGGKKAATAEAEKKVKSGGGMDPMVDPKGLSHLGSIRRSLPRFEKYKKLWRLTRGMPMWLLTLLDVTGSMGGNIELAFESLPLLYEMLTSGKIPILGRYDVQIGTSAFGDVDDEKTPQGIPPFTWTQFEMAEKIAIQMSKLIPTKGGGSNNKESPEFGLFGAAYLTNCRINDYGLKGYHFTLSDDNVPENIDLYWLKQIYGDGVLDTAKENGYEFKGGKLPNTARVVADLQKKAHAFFLEVHGPAVQEQWAGFYGADHVVQIPSTQNLHAVQATIIGLTEGVITLTTAGEFLEEHGISKADAKAIVRSVAHIPVGAQTLLPNFSKLPLAGDLFAEKTDLWPAEAVEVAAEEDEKPDEDEPGFK